MHVCIGITSKPIDHFINCLHIKEKDDNILLERGYESLVTLKEFSLRCIELL